MKKTSFIKVLALFLISAVLLCSCSAVTDAVQSIAGAAVESVEQEVSSAISEGMAEMSSAVLEAKSEIYSANSEIAENIDSIATSVSEQISSDLSEAVDNIVTETTAVSTTAETTVTSAEAETTKEPEKSESTETKWYTFRNKTRYDEHYEKHGNEFGKITKEEYLQLANDLINSTSDRVLHKYSEDGDYMYFDQDTGYFLVLSEDGYIRTFFIPRAGINYWNRQ